MATGTDRISGDVPVTDAETAATRIGADDTVLVSGFGSVGYPKAIPTALARSDRDLDLTVISGGSVGEEIDGALFEADAVARRYPYQGHPAARTAVNEGSVAYHDRHVSQLGDEVELGHLGEPDVAVVEAIEVGEEWLVPSMSIGHTAAYVRAAPRLVVEVNRSPPRGLRELYDIYQRELPPNREPIPLTAPGERIGQSTVAFDSQKLEAVVRTDARDDPYEFREPTADDGQIAENLAEFLQAEMAKNPILKERIALQFGVGSLGNALMGELTDIEYGDRDVVYYGEVIQDGLLDMLDTGQLELASATSLALSADGIDRLFSDVEAYADDVILRNTDITNNAALIEQFGVVGVNSALEVDIYGHVNSTHVDGSRVINGLGGSGDFSRNCPISVITLPSTAGDGDISRIVPMVPHADHTEHDIDVVVTENGVADLRGLSPRERAQVLIENCAHRDYRTSLREYVDRAATGGGHIPHDLETAFDWTGATDE